MLHKIRWKGRYLGQVQGNCIISVDGTDFKIHEPTPFSPRWFSHKFRGPGVRYEVGICIATGDIVWIHGPFPCGSFADLRIFRLAMKHVLDDDEYVVADGWYQDERCQTPNNRGQSPLHALIRARHETINRRFKQFNVLGHRFRLSLSLHSICFHAVANLTQIMIESGDRPFSVV